MRKVRLKAGILLRVTEQVKIEWGMAQASLQVCPAGKCSVLPVPSWKDSVLPGTVRVGVWPVGLWTGVTGL